MKQIKEEKEQKVKEKKKIDKRQLAVRIMAGILAMLMVLAAMATLLYYLFQ